MITSLQVRLFALALQWPVALTGLRPLSVCVGMLLAGTNGVAQLQSSSSDERAASSCEAPALIDRLKAIESDRVLMVIGEVLDLLSL